MSDRLENAIAAFRGVEPHAIINRAALYAAINAERDECMAEALKHKTAVQVANALAERD